MPHAKAQRPQGVRWFASSFVSFGENRHGSGDCGVAWMERTGRPKETKRGEKAEKPALWCATRSDRCGVACGTEEPDENASRHAARTARCAVVCVLFRFFRREPPWIRRLRCGVDGKDGKAERNEKRRKSGRNRRFGVRHVATVAALRAARKSLTGTPGVTPQGPQSEQWFASSFVSFGENRHGSGDCGVAWMEGTGRPKETKRGEKAEKPALWCATRSDRCGVACGTEEPDRNTGRHAARTAE